MTLTWKDVEDLIPEADLTPREVAAIRRRFNQPRDPQGAYLTHIPSLRSRLVLSALSKLRKVKEKKEKK